MTIATKLDKLHAQVTTNKWMRYFTTFNRLALAAGFIPAGYVKIIGERFTDLSNNQPMGHYLEALHHTEYYYTFIGIAQVVAGLLLLIPRTAVLGAMLYLPIILNICILSLAVRFEGSMLTSPLMVLADVYLLCWYYDRWKLLLPFNLPKVTLKPIASTKFPFVFFAGVFATVIAVSLIPKLYDVKPRNTLKDCRKACLRNKDVAACNIFCDCIHIKGQPIEQALQTYKQAVKKSR